MEVPPQWPPGLLRSLDPSPALNQPNIESLTALAQLLRIIPEHRKLFVSYHHGGDQSFYDALARLCGDSDFLSDGSVDRIIDSENAEYQERRIREEYITGTSATIVLCGAKTFERKFVDWEICASLNKEHGLVGLKLPMVSLSALGRVTVPDRLYDNWASGYALWQSWDEL